MAGHDRDAFAEELCKLVRQRRIRATTGANLQSLTAEAIEAVAARIPRDGGAMAIGREGLRGKDEFLKMVFERTAGERADDDL